MQEPPRPQPPPRRGLLQGGCAPCTPLAPAPFIKAACSRLHTASHLSGSRCGYGSALLHLTVVVCLVISVAPAVCYRIAHIAGSVGHQLLAPGYGIARKLPCAADCITRHLADILTDAALCPRLRPGCLPDCGCRCRLRQPCARLIPSAAAGCQVQDTEQRRRSQKQFSFHRFISLHELHSSSVSVCRRIPVSCLVCFANSFLYLP